jgi:hypothetical protein
MQFAERSNQRCRHHNTLGRRRYVEDGAVDIEQDRELGKVDEAFQSCIAPCVFHMDGYLPIAEVTVSSVPSSRDGASSHTHQRVPGSRWESNLIDCTIPV